MHRMKHMAGWGRTTFWLMTGVMGCLWMTGCVMYMLPATELMDMSPTLETVRRTSGIVHGVVAWLFCVMCGRGVWPHVRVMWHRHAQQYKWWWGMANLVLLVFLAFGGLVLLYGSPSLHDVLAPWHFWVGAAGPLIYLVHTWGRYLP